MAEKNFYKMDNVQTERAIDVARSAGIIYLSLGRYHITAAAKAVGCCQYYNRNYNV